MKKGINKNCETCNREFYVRPYQANDKTRRFCSLKCKGVGRDIKGENNPRWKGGLPFCLECKKKLSQRGYKYCLNHRAKGENSSVWKGNKVGYYALHMWVYREKGRPKKCEFCGSGNNLAWANKSQLYKREIDDWIRLCRKCHYKYDNQAKERNRNEYGQFI